MFIFIPFKCLDGHHTNDNCPNAEPKQLAWHLPDVRALKGDPSQPVNKKSKGQEFTEKLKGVGIVFAGKEKSA